MLTRLLILGFLSAALARAEDKPVAYDHITGKEDALDQQVNEALASRYKIVPLKDSPSYSDPKVTAGSLPHSARTKSGESLHGYVLVAYVVTADGRAADVIILKTTDVRLNSFALAAMADWRFAPAKLNGRSIATTAAQEFNFEEEKPVQGFAVDNIVLYQPNDVLTQRLPGPDALAAYIKQLQAVLTDFYAETKTPATLYTVVAVRPGGRSRVWFMSSTESGDFTNLRALRQKLETIKPVAVTGGPVAFTISGSIAGGDDKKPAEDKDYQPPIPQEWENAVKNAKQPVLIPDGMLDAVWPDKT